MCGRFTQKLTWRQIHNFYSLTGPPPLNLQPRYNGAPAQDFAAFRLDEDGNRAIAQLRWGLVPSWAQDARMGTRLINTRSETVHTKQPYFLRLADGSPLSFAALWECWNKGGEYLGSFTIITTAASPGLADIHYRQLAVIDPDRFDDWLDPTSPVPRLLDLVRELYGGPYERRPVNTKVNSARNNDPNILVPMSERGLF